jgi:undecaprenyl-diphosphatase
LDLIKSIILGIVQGLSEFLPISSSGHLVLAQEILNFKPDGIAFEVFVHFGTLLAVLLFFRRDVWEMIICLPWIPKFVLNGFKVETTRDKYISLTLYIIIGSIPAAVIGLFFRSEIEQLFDSPLLVLSALFVTGVIIWSSRYTTDTKNPVNAITAFIIGFAQAFAILPGISRSGSTIVTGMWMRVNRQEAAMFSFLLSIPVIFGATLAKLKELVESPPPTNEIIELTVATLASAISGYLAIVWLLKIIRKNKFEWFGVYCIVISFIGFILISL